MKKNHSSFFDDCVLFEIVKKLIYIHTNIVVVINNVSASC